MKTISQQKYTWLKYKKDYMENKKDLTIDISDEEYENLIQYDNNLKEDNNENDEYNITSEDPNINKLNYLNIEALEDGSIIFDMNKMSPKSAIFHISYFGFSINDYKYFTYYIYNKLLNEENNIFIHNIYKGDKIYIVYNPNGAGESCFPNINFNFKLCGNILTYKTEYHKYFLNEEQLNLDGVEFHLQSHEKCLLYDIYMYLKELFLQ